MRIGVYFCNCGTNVSETIDPEEVRRCVECTPGVSYITRSDFLCSDSGASAMESDIREKRPDRVVVAACSVREHEETFRGVMDRAGLNPFLMQMVNIREHIAWVTAVKWCGGAGAESAGVYRPAVRIIHAAEDAPLRSPAHSITSTSQRPAISAHFQAQSLTSHARHCRLEVIGMATPA